MQPGIQALCHERGTEGEPPTSIMVWSEKGIAYRNSLAIAGNKTFFVVSSSGAVAAADATTTKILREVPSLRIVCSVWSKG